MKRNFLFTIAAVALTAGSTFGQETADSPSLGAATLTYGSSNVYNSSSTMVSAGTLSLSTGASVFNASAVSNASVVSLVGSVSLAGSVSTAGTLFLLNQTNTESPAVSGGTLSILDSTIVGNTSLGNTSGTLTINGSTASEGTLASLGSAWRFGSVSQTLSPLSLGTGSTVFFGSSSPLIGAPITTASDLGQTIPEPTGSMLLGIGALGLFGKRRRTARQK